MKNVVYYINLLLYNFVEVRIIICGNYLIVFQSFLKLVKTWEKAIYSSSTIINAVISHRETYKDKLSKEDVQLLYECLAILYTNQSNYADALSVYLK